MRDLRWSRFKNFAGPEMFRIVDEHVFPFIRALNGEGTSYARHMRDARFQIPGPALLAKVVDKLDKLDMGDRDTKGDVYEYMLAKIASAGQNGQFRTPRHIIAMMVELVQPKPEDVICDPACGTCGFLVAAGEYLRKHHSALFRDDKPLALVEAKRTRKDPRVGQQQAKLYADCLEAQYGQRPIIFYSNGYDHWVWDDTRHPPRPIQGFLKKDELALMIQRRETRKALAAENIDCAIVERFYQERAIRRVAEAFERDKQRKALVVMATGAGNGIDPGSSDGRVLAGHYVANARNRSSAAASLGQADRVQEAAVGLFRFRRSRGWGDRHHSLGHSGRHRHERLPTQGESVSQIAREPHRSAQGETERTTYPDRSEGA